MAKPIIAATRLEAQHYKELQQLATDARRSLSDYLRLMIEDHLKTHRPKTRIRA